MSFILSPSTVISLCLFLLLGAKRQLENSPFGREKWIEESWICLHASGGRCAKTEPNSYWLCETKNKRCGSRILTTKRVTRTKTKQKYLHQCWGVLRSYCKRFFFVKEVAHIGYLFLLSILHSLQRKVKSRISVNASELSFK